VRRDQLVDPRRIIHLLIGAIRAPKVRTFLVEHANPSIQMQQGIVRVLRVLEHCLLLQILVGGYVALMVRVRLSISTLPLRRQLLGIVGERLLRSCCLIGCRLRVLHVAQDQRLVHLLVKVRLVLLVG